MRLGLTLAIVGVIVLLPKIGLHIPGLPTARTVVDHSVVSAPADRPDVNPLPGDLTSVDMKLIAPGEGKSEQGQSEKMKLRSKSAD